MNQVKAQVLSNTRVLPGLERVHGRSLGGAYVIRLKAPQIAGEARPGQFVMVRCGESVLPRPFSIHGVKDGAILLLYNVWEEGKGTAWLAGRAPGDELDIFGALGNGFSIISGASKLLLVAGGIGIAPLCFLADAALDMKKEVRLLAGAATADQVCPRDLAPEGVVFRCVTEDGSAGQSGLVTDRMAAHTAWADQVFACGPLPMYRALAAHMRELKLEGKPVQVSMEMRMGCGVGVCYSCTINTKHGLKQVCQDGPVFELEDIIWDDLTRV